MWISVKVISSRVSKTGRKKNLTLIVFCNISFFFFFSLTESSKELEELRGTFSRSLDYMKQDVEESKWVELRFVFVLCFFWFSCNSLCSCGFAGFGESGDPSCIIMQVWARIEVSTVTMTTIFKSGTSVMISCVNPVLNLFF